MSTKDEKREDGSKGNATGEKQKGSISQIKEKAKRKEFEEHLKSFGVNLSILTKTLMASPNANWKMEELAQVTGLSVDVIAMLQTLTDLRFTAMQYAHLMIGETVGIRFNPETKNIGIGNLAEINKREENINNEKGKKERNSPE